MPPSSPLNITPTDLANPAHASALLELLEHYARDPMGGGQGLSRFAHAHLVERLASREDFLGFIAWQRNEPLGLINSFEGFSTFAARPLLNIHDLVVRADRRSGGIGQALLQAAEDAARTRNCCKLTLEVLSNNHPAQASYTRFGFRPYALDPAAGPALFLEKPLI